jgi:hypothetical protein
MRRSWLKNFCRILFTGVAGPCGVFIASEFALHAVSITPFANIDVTGEANPLFASALRIRDPVYTHTLAANFDGYDTYGGATYPVFTNSLGFRDFSARRVALAADRHRIIFVGSSFLEGIGIPYEQSFIGRFALAFPNIDVLNAAVTGYGPSAYYEKLRYFIDAGFKFDEAIVYIDPANVQDEAVSYSYNERGTLRWNGSGCNLKPTPWWQRASYIAAFISRKIWERKRANYLDHASLDDLMRPGEIYGRDFARASWTYDPAAPCYGTMGVEGGIAKEKWQMDRLYELLLKHGVDLSVGVYPWPQQLLYDCQESRQVRIWRNWCVGKCKHFFNSFPVLFSYKERHPDSLQRLFIWGDSHCTKLCYQIMAADLIEQYRHPQPTSGASTDFSP